MSLWNRILRIAQSELHHQMSATETMQKATTTLKHEQQEPHYATNNTAGTFDKKDAELARHYAILGLPYGSSLRAIKAEYKRQMRVYHPDRHMNDPRLHEAATHLTQQLQASYSYLQNRLDPKMPAKGPTTTR